MSSIIINNALWLTKHAAYVAAVTAEYFDYLMLFCNFLTKIDIKKL